MNERSFIVKSFDKTGSDTGIFYSLLPPGIGIVPASSKPAAGCRLKAWPSNHALF
jgi:hypothetical protein